MVHEHEYSELVETEVYDEKFVKDVFKCANCNRARMDTSVMPLDENDKPMIDEPMKLLASDYGHVELAPMGSDGKIKSSPIYYFYID